uniref:Uncharacterized protein n=1 Tax=viral metagenome TaxID=1070528 RepID=A0A6M3IYC2_9ZZZZ
MKCIALSRNVTVNECARAQKEIPRKFCDGCEYTSDAIANLANKKPEKTGARVHPKHTIYITKKINDQLLKAAKTYNMNPRDFIISVLSEKLKALNP